MAHFLRPFVESLMQRSLRKAFRRVCWVGDLPTFSPASPVILYINHHHFYDGFLAWLVIDRLLHRPGLTWMEELDRFPFFRAAGALPFPADDPIRRATTMRTTMRRFRTTPAPALAYFPEGRLHSPDEGIVPFDTTLLARLDRLLLDALWWPLGIHVTWWNEAMPTVLLGGGDPHAAISGEEPERLRSVWQAVRCSKPPDCQTLLEGRRSTPERINLSFLRGYF